MCVCECVCMCRLSCGTAKAKAKKTQLRIVWQVVGPNEGKQIRIKVKQLGPLYALMWSNGAEINSRIMSSSCGVS